MFVVAGIPEAAADTARTSPPLPDGPRLMKCGAGAFILLGFWGKPPLCPIGMFNPPPGPTPGSPPPGPPPTLYSGRPCWRRGALTVTCKPRDATQRRSAQKRGRSSHAL